MRKGFTVVELVIVLLFVGGVVGYCLNIYKFASCDFEAPIKAEVIHGVGIIIPAIGAVTGYMSLGE